MSVDQTASLNVLRPTSQGERSVCRTAHGTPTPVQPDGEHASVLDGVTPTSTVGWRITAPHALRC